MRGNAEAHELIAPASLEAALHALADEPGAWTPIAGGTELMVAHAAGKLSAKKLLNLWGIPELRFIQSTTTSIAIGACATFRDLRTHTAIAADAPLLAKAATWIGAIANQNRATIGGNLVNGSPAADSSPALLVYDAELELISVRGTRRVPYADFHTGYKTNVLAPDELLLAVHVPCRFDAHKQYLRKVGTRRAMAISKVALAGTTLVESGTIQEIRIAAASLAAYPARLYRTEESLVGHTISPALIQTARRTLMGEAAPIDDIRSTAEYRKQVAANLLEEFLNGLQAEGASR
jgi:CO/xanthine dehydrogenase FAD-binding subunit